MQILNFFVLLILSVVPMVEAKERLTLEEKRFLEVYQAYQQGHYKQALQGLESTWSDGFLLEPEVLYFAGRSHSALENWVKALFFFDALDEKFPNHRWQKELAEIRAEHAETKGDWDASIRWWKKVQDLAESPYETIKARYHLSRLRYQRGEKEGATQELVTLWKEAPSKTWLQKIEVALQEMKIFPLENELAVITLIENLVEKRRFKEASTYLEQISLRTGGVLSETGIFLQAKIFYGQGQYQEALPLFEQIVVRSKNQPLRTASENRKFSILIRLKKYQEVQPSLYYERAKKVYGPSAAAKRWLQLILQSDQYDLLLKTEGVLSKKEESWWKGWAHYQLGQYEAAFQMWEGEKDLRARYWQGRALGSLRKTEEANKIFHAIAEEDPLGYYGWLSVESQHFIKKFWQAEKKDLPRPSQLAKYDVSLLRVKKMVALGLKELAQEELMFWYANRSRNRALNLAALNLAHTIDHVYVGLSLAQTGSKDLFEKLPPPASVQRFYWELGYPKGYRAVVEKEAKRLKLDPLLIYSLIRAESTFRPAILSDAGAVGLMQLIPDTAERVASAAGDPDFKEEDLQDPAKNIALGCLYFKLLMEIFPEHFTYALAAYNAGEEAVSRWIGDGKNADFEAFVEEIPYDQTQNYVKKIIRYYSIYKWLYASQ